MSDAMIRVGDPVLTTEVVAIPEWRYRDIPAGMLGWALKVGTADDGTALVAVHFGRYWPDVWCPRSKITLGTGAPNIWPTAP